MPLQATSGAASYDGFGGGVPFTPTYIEDVFSTWLYPGNSSTQTINNGIDLAGKGGLVWLKVRDSNYGHRLTDSSSSFDGYLESNSTIARSSPWGGTPPVFQATSSGFNLNGNFNQINVNTVNYVSWTFRKQPKFFDVVTYTGNGTAGRTVAHSLGSVPGCMIVKCTSDGSNWIVYHRGLGSPLKFLQLNTTIDASNAFVWNNTDPTATVFTVGGTGIEVNDSGKTYVAYLFAHNAGGFGLTGTDNVISCGSFTTDGSGYIPAVTLGYEPQLLLFKASSTTGNWAIWDTMRGFSQTSDLNLSPNTSAAESDFGSVIEPTATGFQNGDGAGFNPSVTYIYIAIRRGPMKTPTSGTSVFSPDTSFSSGAATTNFPVDSMWANKRSISNSDQTAIASRLTGQAYSVTSQTYAEGTDTGINFASNTQSIWTGFFASGVRYSFGRAPGFFDVVCYPGTGGSQTVSHNLGVAPELIIVKGRDQTASWWTYSATLGYTQSVRVNLSDAAVSGETRFGSSNPTASSFYVNATTSGGTNSSGFNYVAYLFASCPGVSKVGSYTGTGALQTINCGFTGGARFVLIKRTDSTGDWFVYDSARGISSGNDPYLLLNSTAAEVTGTNYVDTTSVGFQVTAAAPAGLNASGGTYIFLAIA